MSKYDKTIFYMAAVLVIFITGLLIASCVSIAITTGNGDVEQTKQDAEHQDDPEINITGVDE